MHLTSNTHTAKSSIRARKEPNTANYTHTRMHTRTVCTSLDNMDPLFKKKRGNQTRSTLLGGWMIHPPMHLAQQGQELVRGQEGVVRAAGRLQRMVQIREGCPAPLVLLPLSLGLHTDNTRDGGCCSPDRVSSWPGPFWTNTCRTPACEPSARQSTGKRFKGGRRGRGHLSTSQEDVL